MKDRIITLKNYENVADAMFDQEVLKENEIDNFLGNENLVEIYPMLNEINEGLKIIVFEKDYEKALNVLEEYHSKTKK